MARSAAPSGVVRHRAARDVQVGADADVVDADGVAISLSPSTYVSRLLKKCQMPIEPPVSLIARA